MDLEITPPSNLKNGIVSSNPLDYLLSWNGKPYLPLSRYLPHQLAVLQGSPKRFKVAIWHRKARKTYTAITEIVKQAHLRRGVYWHVFPTKAEAKDAIWRDPAMLFDIIPEQLVYKRNETELVIYFNNGSIYQLKGSDDPDALRGPNPFGVVWDEFDTQKVDGWGIVEPILRANGGWSWFIGTPRGRQKLYDFYNRGQSGHPEWGSWLLRADKSGIIAADQLAEARKSMTESLYRQEFLCDFLEAAGSVFRGVSAIMTAKPEDPGLPENKNKLYVMGVDLAKVQDWTVLRVYDRETNNLVYSDRFQTLEWPFQKKRIVATANKFNHAVAVVDATGVGDPIVDDLMRAGISVIPFKITHESKKELIEKLSIWIEQRRIRLLPQEEALLEYENFSYEMSKQGKVFYGARAGYHDDIVCFTAGTLILTNKGQIPIEKLRIGDIVMTRKGFKPIVNTLSRIKEVIYNRKLHLIGTKDHPIITTHGEKPLANISDNDIIYTWNEKQSVIEEKTIIDIPVQKDANLEFIFGDMINLKNHLLHCIGKFGLIISEKFLQAILFIIRMKILLIIKLVTCNCLSEKNITGNICFLQNREKDQVKMVKNKQLLCWQVLRNGEKKIQNFTMNKQLLMVKILKIKIILKYGQRKIQNLLMKFAVRMVKDKLLKVLKFLRSGEKKIQNLIRKCEARMVRDMDIIKKRVYNLTVADAPEYFANNVLVHNCADALAVWNLQEVYIPTLTKELSPIQIAFARAKINYENRQNAEDQDADW